MPWKKRPLIRMAYFTMYLFFAVAGVFAFFFPSQAIQDATQSSFVYLWAGFLLSGGAFSLQSPLCNSWRGELLGLPLLSASNMIFGVALLGYGKTAAALAIGLVFCGIGFGFVGRWMEIRGKARIAREVGDGS